MNEPALTPLQRLAELCGIETTWRDRHGMRRQVDADVLGRLLAAMGIDVGHPQALAAALEEHETRDWRRVLPPVLVIQEDAAPEVPCVVKAARGGELKWVLTLESGVRHEGAVSIAALPVVDRRRLADGPRLRCRLVLPLRLPPGYHDFELFAGAVRDSGAMRLIVAPGRCYQPEAFAGAGRAWGLTVPLYAVRSRRNWGIGEFTDARALVELCAGIGAGAIGIGAIAAPVAADCVDPYRPSSRLFLNVLHLDVEAIADFAEAQAAQQLVVSRDLLNRLRTLREAELVDYAAVAACKAAVLSALYEHFRRHHLGDASERGRAFRRFQEAGGAPLRLFATHEALREHLSAAEPSLKGWPTWPAAFRDPASPEVAAFSAAHGERIEYFEYLQWQADLQLSAASARSLELHLRVGLGVDFATAVAPSAAEVWADPHLYVGAGVPVPQRLAEARYEPIIDAVRRAMRHAGALRIDSLAAWMRRYCALGAEPAEGACLRYPFDDLLGIVALESQRNHCVVIADDCADLPQTVAERLDAKGILSFRPLTSQVDEQGEFTPPAAYPRNALVAVGRSDMPTLAGFWIARDLTERVELGVVSAAELAKEQRVLMRGRERGHLLLALERAALLPAGTSVIPEAVPEVGGSLALAVHQFLARTPAKLMLVRLEDVLGQTDQASLPGTEGKRPNWQRRLPLSLEDLGAEGALRALAAMLTKERDSTPWTLEAAAVEKRIPRATYRLQFNRDFTFSDAAELVPYLDDLGVSHAYCSPYLRARAGSTHGYDIVDHSVFNPDLGSAEDFERFSAALRQHGVGQMLDLVPNHMGIMYADNAWWLDVLENGQASLYAEYFDIDWEPLKDELRGKVLVPILGDQYGVVLERGELRLAFERERGEFSIWYYEHRFPLDPREYPAIIGWQLDHLLTALGAEHPKLSELQTLATAFGNLPARHRSAPDKIAQRNRDKEVHKRHLAALCAEVPEIARFIDENVAELNGTVGRAESFDALHDIIKAQVFRLAYWRVAADDINYRRFFDINDLAALKMERAEVFAATHRLVLDLVGRGIVDALRIDHADGLYDPLAYLTQLQQRCAAARLPETAQAGDKARAGDVKPMYVVVEKIAASYEDFSQDWPIYGTTGYRFANLVNGLFVDAAGEVKIERVYTAFIGERTDFEELLYGCRKLIMGVAMASDFNVLANQLSRIALRDRHTCDFTVNKLRAALTEVVACFPVYRTYIAPGRIGDTDRRFIDWAVGAAKKRGQAADITVFDFVRSVLLTSIGEGKDPDYRAAVENFAMKFQQVTGPVMAKGMEDTAFYRYNRLLSLNEVGGDPRRFGVSVAAFHRANQERAAAWPHTLLATSTHDSKRSEDVRARINVLSEVPAVWRLCLSRWRRLNRRKGRVVDAKPAPSPCDEYLLYQTLLGVWPLGDIDQPRLDALRARIEQYMLKVVREAKLHSSWMNPNKEYEEAVTGFVRSLLGSLQRNPFLNDFIPFQKRVARIGMFNSLSQTLLKLTAPGVPDIYQGNEVWDFSLVDPDNRRPVDYGHRRAVLQQVRAIDALEHRSRAEAVRNLLGSMEDGAIKLLLTRGALRLRSGQPELFARGGYSALEVSGAKAEHVCAFARRDAEHAVIVVVPRLLARLLGEDAASPVGTAVWEDTAVELPSALAAATCTDVFTARGLRATQRDGKPLLPMADLLADFPVALLSTLA